MSWNNIIPWKFLFPQTLCKVCKHKYVHHRLDVGCIGPIDSDEDKESFYMGTCKSNCKKYCETNLDYLEYKYEQKYNKR